MILFQSCITLCSLLLVRFHSQSILSTVLHHLSNVIALFIVFIHLCMLSTVCSINIVLSFSFKCDDCFLLMLLRQEQQVMGVGLWQIGDSCNVLAAVISVIVIIMVQEMIKCFGCWLMTL